MQWSEKQIPRTKSVPPCHKKQDVAGAKEAEKSQAVTKSVTPSAENPIGASQ